MSLIPRPSKIGVGERPGTHCLCMHVISGNCYVMTRMTKMTHTGEGVNLMTFT